MKTASLPFARTYLHLQRYRVILSVLLKHGFEDVIHSLQIDKHVGVSLEKISRPWAERVHTTTRPERVRLVLEELGPAFIKIGQFLSTRADLFPPEYLEQLAKLQDRVPPFSASSARAIVQKELKAPVEKLFRRFASEPFAAASIGQAHRAATWGGVEVVVKVQRPDIRQTVAVDLDIMRHLAGLADRHWDDKSERVSRVVDEWARTMERELDYSVEAASMERFARQFERDPSVKVPAVHHELLSPRVLTTEWLDGIKVSDQEGLRGAGIEPRAVPKRMMTHMMNQVFVHGFFHADPHPGNILVLPEGIIGYLDFGMMGRLDASCRLHLEALVGAIALRDARALREALTDVAISDDVVEARTLEKELDELIDQHAYLPLKELRIGLLLQQVLRLCSDHHLVFPPELFLLAKALSNLESVAGALDPDFDVIREAAPFLRALRERRMNPRRIVEDIVGSGLDSWRAVRDFPEEARRLMTQVARGRLKIEFEHRGLEPLLAKHDQASNRLSFAIVLAALIIGSSLIVLAGVAPHWHGLPVIGLTGYVLAALMGFRLLISILRHGRL